MATVVYTRAVSAFPNGLATDRFDLEIRQSPYISIALAYVSEGGANVQIAFKASLTTPEEAALDQLIAAHSGRALEDPRNADGVPLVALAGHANKVQIVGREGDQTIWSTHNFCDPCTWYCEAVRVSNEVLNVAQGETLIYESVNANWIDMEHGRVLGEDELVAAHLAGGGHGWSVQIRDNGSLLTARAPFATSGGDYWVEYSGPNNGKARVHFAQVPTGPVEATYSKAGHSDWHLVPTEGKMLAVEDVEAQFTADVVQNDTFLFGVDVPDGQGGDVFVQIRQYRTMAQIIDEARGAYPVIPAIGGESRGVTEATYGFPFQYKTVRDLRSSQGVALCVKLKDHKPMGGKRCTVTFYCTSNDE